MEIEKGLEMLYIFQRYVSRTSLLDEPSTSTASPKNSSDIERLRIKYYTDEGKNDQEREQEEAKDKQIKDKGKNDQEREEEEEAAKDKQIKGKEKEEAKDKQKGKEKEEEVGGEKSEHEYCNGSGSCDISSNEIKQETIEDSPWDMQLQQIVNTTCRIM